MKLLRKFFRPDNEARWAVVIAKLDLILKNQGTIMTTQTDIAAALAKLQADVTAQTTVEAGVATFIQGLQAQITALAGSTTDTTTADALNALSTQIETNTTGLSTAMTANTPTPPVADVTQDKPA